MLRRQFLIGSTVLAMHSKSLSRPLSRIESIDTHAHIFKRDLPVASDSRYLVNYDASLSAYLEMLDTAGMAKGVLIQPSFLGRDNSYLLDAVERNLDRLRGVVMLSPETPFEDMQAMSRKGVVGIRLNLIGKSDPDFTNSGLFQHLKNVAKLGWQVEIQVEASRLPRILPPLVGLDLDIVLDHFGRPNSDDGTADPGFQYFLGLGRTGKLWVKMSGWYRLAPGERGLAIARSAAEILLDRLGPEQLLFGSDWPHTQFETVATPDAAKSEFYKWVPNEMDRRVILSDTPRRLFGFDYLPAGKETLINKGELMPSINR